MISLARFDLPAAPSGWEGAGTDLVRIVDPRGEAIAWLAPRFAGACVGFAIRQKHPQLSCESWLHALVSGTPELVRSNPENFGCVPIGDAVQGASWDLVQRDPTGASLIGVLHPPFPRLGYETLLTAEIDGGILHLSMSSNPTETRSIGWVVTILREHSPLLAISGTGGVLHTVTNQSEEATITRRYIGTGEAITLAIGPSKYP